MWTWREADALLERTGFEPQVWWLLPLPYGEQPLFPVLLRGHGPVSFSLWFLLCFPVLNKSGGICAACLADGPYATQRPPAHRGDTRLSNGTLSVSDHLRHGDKDWHVGYFPLEFKTHYLWSSVLVVPYSFLNQSHERCNVVKLRFLQHT